jgi:hypothetical protein
MLRLNYRYYRNGTSAQPPTTLGTSAGIQSPRADHQTLPITGEDFQGPTTSQDGLQANRSATEIPFHSVPEPIANEVRTYLTNNQAFQMQSTASMDTPLVNPGLLVPAPTPIGLKLGQDKGNFGCVLPSTSVQSSSQWRSRMPDWIALIKPSPPVGENVIKLRRETRVALEIILDRLPRQPPGGCSGIKIPATASVRNYANSIGKPLLEFRIHVYGATSKRRYDTVCASCEKRERKNMGTPSFIDFCAVSDIIEHKDGRVRVEFVLCCYPKCHQDSGYL